MALRFPSDSNLALTMDLLWGQPKRAGWSGLSASTIVGAAVTLADENGLDAVSMRKIAERLGVGTMSLYAHVPGKADLVSLMVDRVLGELYDAGGPQNRAPGWREGLVGVARANWDLWERHPWLLEVSGARPVMGPHACRKYEVELLCLEGAGFSDLEMDSLLGLVLTHVEGVARARWAMRSAERVTGRTDRAWWDEVSVLLARYIDGSQFPVSGRVGTAAGEAYQAVGNPEEAFRFGLERILDGAQLLLARGTNGSAET